MADPLGIATTILSTTSSILDWYLEHQAKEPALEALRTTVTHVESVLSPLIKHSQTPNMAQLDSGVEGSLKAILVELLKAQEHLEVWGETSDSHAKKWDKFLAFWKPSVLLDDLKEDEQRIYNNLLILNTAFGMHLHLLFAVPNFATVSAKQGRQGPGYAHPTPTTLRTASDAQQFWRQEIGPEVPFCAFDLFWVALSRWLRKTIEADDRLLLGLNLDEYGMKGISRSAFETMMGESKVADTINNILKVSETPIITANAPTSPMVIWVDDNFPAIKKDVEEARKHGLEVRHFPSTALAKVWIQTNMSLLYAAERAEHIRFISDYARYEKDDQNPNRSFNTSAGDQLLRFLRGHRLQAPFLLFTGKKSIGKTGFVSQYTNAGSTASHVVLVEFIKSLRTGVDDRWWQDAFVKARPDTRPLLVFIHDTPEEIATHIELAKAYKLEVTTLKSTWDVKIWVDSHKDLIRRLEGIKSIRFISNNSRVESPYDSPLGLTKTRNIQAGLAVLRLLRRHGSCAPVLIYTRKPGLTSWVKDDPNAGSTGSAEIVQRYMSALAACIDSDVWWKDFYVKPIKETPPVLVWVNDIPESMNHFEEYAKKRGIAVVGFSSTSAAQEWIDTHTRYINRLTAKNSIRVLTDNSRHELANPWNKASTLIKNDLAGRDLVRLLRASGHTCPVLVLSRTMKNTEYVSHFEQAGSTVHYHVVEAYIDALGSRSSTDNQWRKFNALA